MKKKDKIIVKYYECHEQEKQIAKDLKIDPSYVTKIIKQDKRYWHEKANRQDITKSKIKEYKRNWDRENRSSKTEEYDTMMREHDISTTILSNMYKTEISNSNFVRYNRSAYRYNKNSSDLVLKKYIKAGFTAPKKSRNIIHPSFIKTSREYI